MKFAYTLLLEQRTVRIAVYDEKIIRMTFGWKPDRLSSSMIVTGQPTELSEDAVTVDETDSQFCLCTKYLKLAVEKDPLAVRFYRSNGTLLTSLTDHSLAEYDMFRSVGGTAETRQTVDGLRITVQDSEKQYLRKSCHGKLTMRFSEDEELFGLGSHEEGYPSLKGQFVPLYQENMRIALPYIVSTKGYACLFDCTSMMTFDATDRRYGRWYFDSVDAIDYYFIAGDDFDDVCRSYRTLTGVTPMLPKWAVGYIQSRERYVSQEHILDTAAKYRTLGIPIDGIVQDWCTWPGNLWGYKCFDPERYPDPAKMMENLHDQNIHMLISIWPNMNGESADQQEFRRAGKLLGDDSTYNAFDTEARSIYWRQTRDAFYRYGVDGWWCDSSEPFDAVWGGCERPVLHERMQKSVDEFKKYMDDDIVNAYSLAHSRGIYEGQRNDGDRKRVINLTRSGYPGQHRYGTIVWSGDVSATWETLARQIHIAQNYIACGEAYWNCDAGGFFVKQWHQWFGDGDYEAGKDDLGFRELYTRWLQFAGFTPFMRSHGTDTPREVWQFGERGTLFRDAVEKTIELRYRLAPYFYSVHAAVTFEGTMPITALALAFPDDRTARKIGYEFMYGHELLVCPVSHPMYYHAESKEISNPDRYLDVYLPNGGWYDFYTEEYYDGGRYIRIPVDIERIPLFVRAGAILPISPVMPYVDADPTAICEVRVYGGGDGCFTLYNDAGDGYGYEKGEYTALKIHYRDDIGQITETVSGCDAYRRNIRYRIIQK